MCKKRLKVLEKKLKSEVILDIKDDNKILYKNININIQDDIPIFNFIYLESTIYRYGSIFPLFSIDIYNPNHEKIKKESML